MKVFSPVHPLRSVKLRSYISRIPGLIAYYPLNETTGNAVNRNPKSLGTLGGTVAGTVTRGRTSKIGRMMEFDGTDAKVTVTHAASLIPTAAMSLIGFCTLDTLTGSGYRDIINKGSGEEYALDFDEGADKMRGLIKLATSSWQTRNSDVTVTTNTLYMVGITYDGSREVLYLNGRSSESSDVPDEAIATSTEDLVIGARGGDRFWDGMLGHVAVFDRAIPEATMLKIARIAGLA